MECLLYNTFSGLFLLVLAFPVFVVNWQTVTKGQGTYKEGTGQRYSHPRNIFILFSYFENNSFFYPQLVKMVAPEGVLRDRDKTVEIRMKKMIKNLMHQKRISVAKRQDTC